MHTMQLFVKVEETGSEARPCVSSPKFQQVTTHCEFTLDQALENILGGDLTHYEIVGPGAWVKWSTLAKELKGQQLTLRYHSRPVPHTRVAVYGPSLDNTEKRPVTLIPNIPANIGPQSDEDETHLKEAEHTRMENLKFPSLKPHSPSPMSDSNNILIDDSIDKDQAQSEYGIPDSVMPTGPSRTFTHLTLDSKDDEFTLDPTTKVKVPVSRDNTIEQTQVQKVFLDKILYNDSNCLEDKPTHTNLVSPNLLSVLDNVPRLSILEQGFTSVTDNESVSETQQKLLMPHQGHEEKQNNLNCVDTPTHTYNSLTTTAQYPQNVSVSYDTRVTTPYKGTATYQTVTVLPESKMSQTSLKNVSSNDSAMTSEMSCGSSFTADPSISEASEVGQLHNYLTETSDKSQPASSLFNFQANPQLINVSMIAQDVEYVPHTCIQRVDSQAQNVQASSGFRPRDIPVVPQSHLQVEDKIPTPCGSPSQVRTPPQKRHRLDSLSPQQQLQLQHTLQQQELLQRQESEQQQLELHRQQQQWALTCQQNLPSNTAQRQFVNVSAIEVENQHILSQRQQQLEQQQQLQFQPQLQQQQQQQQQQPVNLLFQGGVAVSQQPTGQRHPPVTQVQSWSYQSTDNQTQIQRFYSQTQPGAWQQHQQLQQQSYRIEPTTQPSLILHTPPSSFPDGEVGARSRSGSEPVQFQPVTDPTRMRPSPPQVLPLAGQFLPQCGNPIGFLNQQNSPPGLSSVLNHSINNSPLQTQQSPVAQRHCVNVDPRNAQQYLSMHRPTQSNVRHPQAVASLPGLEFRVRVPQLSEFNIRPDEPRIAMNIVNHSRHSSGASNASSSHEDTPIAATFSGAPSAVRSAGLAAVPGPLVVGSRPTVTCQQPFNPAPPVRDALGRSTNSSSGALGHQSVAKTSSSENANDSDEEGRYNYIDASQMTRSKSLPVNNWSSPSASARPRVNLEEELSRLEGYCETENGDTIQKTMEKYRCKDGAFIIWKSRRHKKFVITVSHLNELIFLRVEETTENDRRVFYLFEGGFRSESLIELVNHYCQNGVPIAVQSASGLKKYHEHIRLRYPLRVRLEKKKK